MDDIELRLPPGELTRLAECVLEPIRFPGAIQPHGVLFAVEPQRFLVRHVSDNTAVHLGVEPIALLGRPIADVFGDRAIAAFRDTLNPDTAASNPIRVTLGDALFDAVVTDAGDLVFVELEPVDPRDPDQVASMRVAFRRLAGAGSVQELWTETAIELQRVTGFDRVMVYHFHPDDHGEVVAEVAAPGMEPFLGLHYPASDIPAQARALYLTKWSRLIASSSPASAALLSDANAGEAIAIDLSRAELRAVSPHHLEFMRNMGQASTFSLSLIRNGVLVGMITCAHRTERHIPYGVREGLEILANQVSLQLGGMLEVERLNRRNRIRETRIALVAQADVADDLVESLLRGAVTVLDLVPADGASIRLGGRLESVGSVPPVAQIDALPAVLLDLGSGNTFTSSSIPLDFPDLARQLDGVAGLLIRPLGGDGDFIAWYRGEVTQTVDWLGDMSLANRVTPLSPRNSFSSWTQEVTGTSTPWSGYERDAAELCRDLDSVLLHRAQAELAGLALRDSLTGLPNRRLLMDRLEQSLASSERDSDLAVLFIDLDRFKVINDTLGHSAGDAALRHVADLLERAARREDTVARLGGDEFVVLCENTTREQAEHVASRLKIALETTPTPDSRWSISASIGIAMASPGEGASHLLSAADLEMYRRKVEARA